MVELTITDRGLPSDQVYDQLRSMILGGALAAGERLPSVRQVARDLSVATGTVAKAYRLLEAEGLVVSRSGAGTRVSARVSAPPSPVLEAARALAQVADAHNFGLEETVSALRASWPREEASQPDSERSPDEPAAGSDPGPTAG